MLLSPNAALQMLGNWGTGLFVGLPFILAAVLRCLRRDCALQDETVTTEVRGNPGISDPVPGQGAPRRTALS